VVATLRGSKAVIAKLGFDAHWRGVIVVANALRDAGMEVVYIGHATPQQVVRVAVQEDADVVGLSSLSGNHMDECGAVLSQLQQADCGDMVVVLGGTVPPADAEELTRRGLSAVFPSGSPLSLICERIAELLTEPARATAP
jgi:methylmalonyl-CoA mutase, C-terminal domain